MTSIIIDNKLFNIGTKSFSRSAHDELLKSHGNYQYWETISNTIIWDIDFVTTLDQYLAGTIYTHSLNLSELNTINKFISYGEEIYAGISILNPIYEALDKLLYLESL